MGRQMEGGMRMHWFLAGFVVTLGVLVVAQELATA